MADRFTAKERDALLALLIEPPSPLTYKQHNALIGKVLRLSPAIRETLAPETPLERAVTRQQDARTEWVTAIHAHHNRVVRDKQRQQRRAAVEYSAARRLYARAVGHEEEP